MFGQRTARQPRVSPANAGEFSATPYLLATAPKLRRKYSVLLLLERFALQEYFRPERFPLARLVEHEYRVDRFIGKLIERAVDLGARRHAIAFLDDLLPLL